MPNFTDHTNAHPHPAQRQPNTAEPQPERELTERQRAQIVFWKHHAGYAKGPVMTDEDLRRENMLDS
jgi:hypothetical protein